MGGFVQPAMLVYQEGSTNSGEGTSDERFWANYSTWKVDGTGVYILVYKDPLLIYRSTF